MDSSPQSRITVFDGHNDTLLDLYLAERGKERSFFERSERGHIDLPRAQEGGFGGGFFAVFVPRDPNAVATHSNVHAIAPSTRNLTDRQLDTIRESDGMVGLNFHVGFLRPDGARDPEVPLETMIRHLDYLVDRLGIERVGFGSDFDGCTVPNEIHDVCGLPKLLAALSRHGYDDASLRKLAHENWLRVLRQTWRNG